MKTLRRFIYQGKIRGKEQECNGTTMNFPIISVHNMNNHNWCSSITSVVWSEHEKKYNKFLGIQKRKWHLGIPFNPSRIWCQTNCFDFYHMRSLCYQIDNNTNNSWISNAPDILLENLLLMPDHHKYRRKLHYAAHQNPLYTVVAMQTPVICSLYCTASWY